jgi:DNA polymerase-3 subunit gamma/tau
VSSVQEAWPAVLSRLASKSRVAWFAFQSASPVSLSQGVLAVAVAEVGNVRAISQKGHDEWLRQALIDELDLDVRIDLLHDPDASRGGTAAGAGDGAAEPGAGHRSPEPLAPAGEDSARTGSDESSPSTMPGTAEAHRATPPEPGGPRAQARRGGDLVRAAAATPEPGDQPDEPSEDDPDLSGADGLALVTRELGARPIGEIDHS